MKIFKKKNKVFKTFQFNKRASYLGEVMKPTEEVEAIPGNPNNLHVSNQLMQPTKINKFYINIRIRLTVKTKTFYLKNCFRALWKTFVSIAFQ